MNTSTEANSQGLVLSNQPKEEKKPKDFSAALTLLQERFQPGLIGNTKVLSKPENLNQIVSVLKEEHANKKMSLYILKTILGRQGIPSEDIAMNISDALRTMQNQDEALFLWKNCDRSLKSLILIPDEMLFDYELYRKLDLPADIVMKCYLQKISFKRPMHYGEYEYDSGERLVELLSGMTRIEAQEVIEGTDIKIFYMIAVIEIEGYLQYSDGEELFSALGADDQVPHELPFLAWLWKAFPAVYQDLVKEILNREWEENREMFYEVYNRSKHIEEVLGRALDDDTDEEYLDDLTKYIDI